MKTNNEKLTILIQKMNLKNEAIEGYEKVAPDLSQEIIGGNNPANNTAACNSSACNSVAC